MGGIFGVLFFFLSSLLLAFPLTAGEISREPVVHHELRVVLHPKKHSFTALDEVTVPASLPSEFRFLLHKGLHPSILTTGARITRERGVVQEGIFDAYKVSLPLGVKTFVLEYGGVIDHPLEQYGKEHARGFKQTAGIISEEGVYLSGSSCWFPVIGNEMVNFDLSVELPSGWDAVSQGERAARKSLESVARAEWRSPEPQEEIFLVASRFHEYSKREGGIPAMVFLRTPDPSLAERYLEATARYVTMYSRLIGPYPYEKFALVENFWETGFGMPSFTLLGPRVIRFPFIIDTSYPHEILHNWWGNGVFADYGKGNWSEGLTAYLSDYLLKEQKGEGGEYRRTVLQKYADYVTGGRDFPLTDFRSRHSSSSEAIGYGKSLMFFHMLRRELGDGVFIRGLRDFYEKNKFRVASFDDIENSFGRVSGRNLESEFEQWVMRPGAPELRIKDVQGGVRDGRYSLAAVIEQVQGGPPYRLLIPVAVTLEGRQGAYQTVVIMNEGMARVDLDLPARPLRVDVDPEFDVFRRLARDETPPAVSQVLGARRLLVILPSEADGPLLRAYREFAAAMSHAGPDEVKSILDTEISALPADRPVIVEGRENRFLKSIMSASSLYGTVMGRENLLIGDAGFSFRNHSFVLTAKNPENKNGAMMFVSSDLPGALQGLSRKLPHYGKYSYLVFEGPEPVNIAKGIWPVVDSPMTVYVPGVKGKTTKIAMGKLEGRKPLAALPADSSEDRMMETIRYLSDDAMKGRASGTEEMGGAAEYIARKFREAGLEPGGDREESYFQTWEEQGRSLKNVIGVIPGKNSEWPGQSVVVGAHYDHLGVVNGRIYHGADDNASGVSVLIELAGILGKSFHPGRSVIFAAFAGEETGRKGSKYYVTHGERYPATQCEGMVNLDTVGRLGKNKLLALGSGSAKEWAHVLTGASHITGVGIEPVSEELDSSDQRSFQEAGVPAMQLFSGPHADYHRPSDTVDKIEAEGLGEVLAVSKEIIAYLADRKTPLTVTVSTGAGSGAAAQKERRVSLGIIPDFSFSGGGCRLSGVIERSPAAMAGLREGDVIVLVDSRKIDRLKDLSDALKSLNAGDKVIITFLREAREMTVVVGLTAR